MLWVVLLDEVARAQDHDGEPGLLHPIGGCQDVPPVQGEREVCRLIAIYDGPCFRAARSFSPVALVA